MIREGNGSNELNVHALVSVSQSPIKKPPVLYPKLKIDSIYQKANHQILKDNRQIKRNFHSNSVISVEKLSNDAFSLYFPQYDSPPLKIVTEK